MILNYVREILTSLLYFCCISLNIFFVHFQGKNCNYYQHHTFAFLSIHISCYVHFIVIIFKYSRAFRAALDWASFDVAPDPWHTATGNVDNWTRHWKRPEYVFSSISTYVTSKWCSAAISSRNWTKLTSLLLRHVVWK